MARKVYILALTVDWTDEPLGRDHSHEEIVEAVVDNSTAREAIGLGVAEHGDLVGLYSMGEIATYAPREIIELDMLGLDELTALLQESLTWENLGLSVRETARKVLQHIYEEGQHA
jgi:hypothetical protein